MDAMPREYAEAGLSRRVIGAFYETYNTLGHGFLESVYENALALEMQAIGLRFQRQPELAVRFRDQIVGVFRAITATELPESNRHQVGLADQFRTQSPDPPSRVLSPSF